MPGRSARARFIPMSKGPPQAFSHKAGAPLSSEEQTPVPKNTVFRKKYLIYPKFQVTLLVANAIALASFFALILVVMAMSNQEMTILGEQAGLTAEHPYFQFLDVQAKSLAASIVVAAGVALLATTVFFVWLSHRLVGPLVGMKSYLAAYQKAAESGQPLPPPIQFRKEDYFQDLAQSLNDALAARPKEQEKKSAS